MGQPQRQLAQHVEQINNANDLHSVRHQVLEFLQFGVGSFRRHECPHRLSAMTLGRHRAEGPPLIPSFHDATTSHLAAKTSSKTVTTSAPPLS